MSLIRGDALTIPLADNTVDLIVTSPPYFALRSYTDACGTCGGSYIQRSMNGKGTSTLKQDGRKNPKPFGPYEQGTGEWNQPDPDCPECEGSGRGHYAGQLGSEATPAAFIDALVSVTRECVRVLKPSGSLFVNLGDKYSGAPPGNPGALQTNRNGLDVSRAGAIDPQGFVRNKSLMGLPWRYALRCIDDLGLILRAEIIWSKPNCLPESVQDRVRRSHEQWFHFTLEPRYYSAVDEIREAHTGGAHDAGTARRAADWLSGEGVTHRFVGSDPADYNPLGKLPGSVWSIPTEPLRVPDDLPQHFAAFPSEWPRRIILGWSPSGICVGCGEGRRPVVATDYIEDHAAERKRGFSDLDEGVVARGNHGAGPNKSRGDNISTISGYSCACPTPDAPTRKAVVLDPFCGTGTTPAVANTLGRFGVGVDLSADYLRLASWRCQDPGLRAKVLGVDKPAPEVPGQMALL